MSIRTQDVLPGKFVTVHTASGDEHAGVMVSAADLVGLWLGNTLIPWAAIDRVEVAR